MAFALRKRVVIQKGYSGPTTVAQFSFPFVFSTGLPGVPGGAIGELDFYISQGLTVSGQRGKVLEYRLESDTTPRIDNYRVTLILMGAPEREVRGVLSSSGFQEQPAAMTYPQAAIVLGIVPLLAIVGVLIALGAVIAVVITEGVSGSVKGLSLLIAGAAIGLGTVMLVNKKRG